MWFGRLSLTHTLLTFATIKLTLLKSLDNYEIKNPILTLTHLRSIPVQSYNTFTSLGLHRVHTKRERKPASEVLRNTTAIQKILYGVEWNGA